MREPPPDLTESDLIATLRAGWDIEATSVDFLPVGAGSHCWSVRDSGGARWFVKADSPGSLDDLRRSLLTAVTLRESGLDFVLAPVRGSGGEILRRLFPTYAISVFPFTEGTAGDFVPHAPDDRHRTIELLAALHGVTTAPAPHLDLRLPGRDRLNEVLRDTGEVWSTGPYAEPARRVLAGHADRIHGWLAEFDTLAAHVRDRGDWVLTHGEPHPGNLLRTAGGPLLIDWDTARIAPPERDLWMLTGGFASMLGLQPAGDDDAVLGHYTSLTGREISGDGLAFFRLWWVLADIAIYADELHRPHGESADLAASLTYLTGYL
ncbi:aminoglycoside phosphotransferase family protein [Actinoplanes sp. NPDC051861]|uniref:aminoglycoside phosphotransferase family protein n=1 Tax=Actinoplanes sp. NPDC051861 TaxID=3155170 RepID=UPI003438066C